MPIGPPSQSPEPKSAWIPPSIPIERTIAFESAATGSVSTRWLVAKEEGKSGQPASVAATVAIGASIGPGFYRPAGSGTAVTGRALGSSRRTASPPPGAGSARTVPPWRSATCFTIASPRPDPARPRAFAAR